MTQHNPRELLKQGDPQAIASSINRTLKPKGINAEVTRDNGCLHIFLESGKVPDQMVLVDFIRTGMTKLGLESIHTVKVYGIETGQDSPAWQEEIELMSASPMLYADDTSMPNDSVDLDDVESDSGDYYQEEEFDQDNDNDDDDEEDDEEEEETPPPKKQFPKWLIPVGILVPVLALAGLFFTKSPPFSSDSTSEPSAPVVAKPSSKAKSGASKPVSPSPGASEGEKPAASPPSAAVPNTTTKPASPSPAAVSPAPKPASPAAKAASPAAKAVAPKSDNWREAVNQAQKAAILAQTAQSQSEWNAVAADWQKAAKLMNSVPTTSPNHQKAQQKAAEYKSNLEVANRRAAAAP
jgi:hypothetical protein